MKLKTHLHHLPAAVSLFAVITLQAATLPIYDDFTGATPGNTLPGWTTTTGGATWTTADTNQYPVFVDRGGGDIAIQWTKGANTRRQAFDIPAMTQGILSADFNFIQDGLDTTTTKDAVYIRVANASTFANGTFAGFYIDRSLKGIDLNSWHTATVIFNGDVSPMAYDTSGLTDTDTLGGLGSVASGAADIFLDGNLITDESIGIVGAYAYAGIILFTSATSPQIVQYDNFSVTAVPEPATVAALLGLGALGFVLIRRRR
jgi:hypothetical protein